MPFDPFVKSLPPLPTRSLSSRERQYVRQLCISSWLHHAHPFLAAAEKGRKNLSYTRIVDVQLFAIVGWKWGCQPFSCRCSQNLTHCRKDTCGTCLFSGIHSRHSFWEFQASTPCQKQVPGSIMVVPFPSLRCSCMKNHKQRVWSRSCGVENLLQCSDCALSCAM